MTNKSKKKKKTNIKETKEEKNREKLTPMD
jgi:hypothetical protein